LGQYAIKKQREYRDRESLFARYAVDHPTIQDRYLESLTWLPRIQRSASAEITREWNAQLAVDWGVLHRIIASRAKKFHSTADFETELAATDSGILVWPTNGS
jgi:hypothetical protein